MELYNVLKKDLMKELSETDFSQIYEDMDILTCIKAYDQLLSIIEAPTTSKIDKSKIQKELHKIEKECLTKNKLVKLIGEEKSYYCSKNEVYDVNGCIVEYDFDIILDEEDLFCEYIGDNIFEIMRKIAIKKIKQIESESECY